MASLVIMPSAEQVLSVNVAPSDRATCKECRCLKPIAKGSMRCSVPMFSNGRTVAASFHPQCLARHGLTAEIITRGNSGMCKMTRKPFAKGDVRVLIHGGNARFGLCVAAAGRLLPPLLTEARMAARDVNGVADLPAADREALLAVIGSGAGGSAAAPASPVKAAAPPSPMKAATPASAMKAATPTSPMKAATPASAMKAAAPTSPVKAVKTPGKATKTLKKGTKTPVRAGSGHTSALKTPVFPAKKPTKKPAKRLGVR